MKKIHYYYFLISLIEIISINDNVYKIKFGLYNEKFSETNIINNIVYNAIYLNLSIGSNEQNVPFELDSNCQTFCVTKEIFNKDASSSYEQISNTDIEISYEVVKKGYQSKDILNIDKDSKKKINFILGTKFGYEKTNKLGIIGLRIPYPVQVEIFPFFDSLKDAELINSFIWTLKFFNNISLSDQIIYDKNKNNIIGEFIFGDEPCNYESDNHLYNNKSYYIINPEVSGETRNWEFKFSNVYIYLKDSENISKIEYESDKNAKVVISYSFISGPVYFLYFMEEHFLQDLIIDDICSEETFESYTYIECSSSLNFETFPNISFEHIGFEYSFNLTAKDLFVFDEKRNKYIFLIFIKDNSMEWELGTVFLRKFQYVFNENSRTIGFYQLYDGNDNNGGDNNGDISTKWKIILIVGLSIIFAILLIFIGMLIQKKICNKNRKQRANELTDNFEYINDENRESINSDKKIMKDDD